MLLVTLAAIAPVFLLSFETASVTVTIPATRLEAPLTVHGATSGGQFKTELVTVTESKSEEGTASGVAKTPARYATGYVVFNHVCGPQYYPGYPCQATPPVSAGNVVWNTQGTMTYVLLATVSCFCGEKIPVRAWSAGTIGNAAAHTISLYVTTLGFTPFESADNPAPISGGAGPTSQPVITQADLDAMRASLTAQVIADLKSQMETSEPGADHVLDSAPTIDVSSDQSAGAHANTFHVTVSGSLGATTFMHADAQASMAAALDAKVQEGYQLIGPPTITDFQVQASNTKGDITVSGKAVAYIMAKIPVDSIRTKLRGLDAPAARQVIQGVAPGSVVEIHMAPVAIFWLPRNAARISIEIVPEYSSSP